MRWKRTLPWRYVIAKLIHDRLRKKAQAGRSADTDGEGIKLCVNGMLYLHIAVYQQQYWKIENPRFILSHAA